LPNDSAAQESRWASNAFADAQQREFLSRMLHIISSDISWSQETP